MLELLACKSLLYEAVQFSDGNANPATPDTNRPDCACSTQLIKGSSSNTEPFAGFTDGD
jgi:hypothetical protein